MACPTLRSMLLVGAVAAVAVAPARAQHTPAPKTVTDCVEEKYEVKRTCYRTECRQVVIDTFRTETVCEPREKICTVTRRIPCYHTECRRVCCKEWCWEERVVMKKCYEYRQVTECVKKCVSKGHWECRTECCKPGFWHRLCHRHDDCCEPCVCKTRKVWVHCPVYVDCPVTRCVKVCVGERPVCCKVRVCREVVKEVPVKVCTYKCVTEQVCQRYYVRVCRQVPCKQVVCQRVCVPYEETVICCRMVPREVPADQVAAHCCTPCCPTPCCDHHHRGHGLRLRHHHHRCDH